MGGGHYCARLQDQNLAANYFEAEPTTKICIQFLVYLTGTMSSIREKEKNDHSCFCCPQFDSNKKPQKTSYL